MRMCVVVCISNQLIRLFVVEDSFLYRREIQTNTTCPAHSVTYCSKCRTVRRDLDQVSVIFYWYTLYYRRLVGTFFSPGILNRIDFGKSSSIALIFCHAYAVLLILLFLHNTQSIIQHSIAHKTFSKPKPFGSLLHFFIQDDGVHSRVEGNLLGGDLFGGSDAETFGSLTALLVHLQLKINNACDNTSL